MEATHCERWRTEDRTSQQDVCASPDPPQGALAALQEHRGPPDPVSQDLDLQVLHRESEGGSDPETSAMLDCKQSAAVTAVCTGASGTEGGAPPPKNRCSCVSPAKADHLSPHPPPPCEQAVCCGSYIHNDHFYHTLAAYCHPHPIPAPAPLLPRLAGMELPRTPQRALAPPAVSTHLSLSHLMSSVSETGLDTKHLLRCCNLSCTWSGTPPTGPPPAGPPPAGPLPAGPPPAGLTAPCQPPSECCRSPAGAQTCSRDQGTMTTSTVLRDVGVQTGQTATSHVFPLICLADDSRSDTPAAKTPQSGRNQKQGGAKSPVKEVKWDAEGMTWEVYGASVDPEELGLAIQKHLELQIKETASRAAKLARQDTNTSRQTSSAHKRSRLVASFRGPGCCSRRTTAKD